MAVLKNRAKMSTSTTGTGTITLGSAESGYQTFADAGVANADVVRYVIEDGNNWEIGTGTYTATGTTLSRTVSESSNADAAINLSGSATVFIGATAEDIPDLYAANESNPSAQPSATGTNAIAIGDRATASGNKSIALGWGQSQGLYSMSGPIGNYLNTYGAIADYSLAIGSDAKASGSYGVALGRSVVASGTQSLSLGFAGTASAINSVAIGDSNTASHANAIVIGDSVQSTTTNEVSIGGTADTVRISESYTLPTSDGTNGQVLTTNGSGNVTFADAGGGGGASAQTIDIKTADYTVVSGDLGKIIKYFGAGADRTVTLTAGATLGEGFHVTILNANSGADERVVIDANSTETFGWANGPQTITLSRGELVRIIWDNTGGRWIIGEGGFNLSMRSDINPATTTAAGDGANGAIALGHNSLATGSQAVSLGRSLASNSYAFAASIANNTSSYGASGANSIAMGYLAKATATGAMAFGDRNTASGEDAVVFGENNVGSGPFSFTAGRNNTNSGSRGVALGNSHTVSDFYTFASGSENTASEDYATAVGSKSLANRQGKFAHASLGFGTVGDSQYGRMILSKATTDATATVLTAIQGNAASSVNMPVIPSGGAQAFSGLLVAKQTGSANVAAWEIKGLIVNNGGTTTLVNSAITVIDNTPSWGGPALSADDTNDWLAITCTGAAATSIRWSCTLNTSELIYA